MRRLRLSIFLCAVGAAVALPAPAIAFTSGAEQWTALGGEVICGIAIHPINTPPMQLLCSATSVPAPKTKGIGDPGFVFLGSTGHPLLARLSQDSFVGSHPVALKPGSSWGGGPITVSCTVTVRTLRCTNRSHHGFTITKRSYRSF